MAYPGTTPYRPVVRGPRTAWVRRRTIQFGDAGSRQTLGSMSRLVRRDLRDPWVLETAAAIVQAERPRDKVGQARAIRRWMQQTTRYLHDPPGVELIRTPQYQLDRIGRDRLVLGDCDDSAVLAAVLGMAAGMRARFVAVGFQGPTGPLTHVWTELLTDGGWVEVDVTRPDGRAVPVPSRRVIREV